MKVFETDVLKVKTSRIKSPLETGLKLNNTIKLRVFLDETVLGDHQFRFC